jgi:hypothetical protein
MKESSIYKLFSAVIDVTISILCGFQEKEDGNTNFTNIPFAQIPKLDEVIDFSACNKTFGTTTTMITAGDFFEEYVTTDIEEYIDVAYVQDVLHNVYFTVLFVVSIAMLAFAGLFQGRK